ncbi:MAG: SusD/RagB family nutrient-binding outer membrane lipoprotein, partial [Bacteroidota bacterium]
MKRYLFFIIILMGASACGDLVDGINQDPNNPTSASYQNILTGAQVGNIILNTGETARRAGIFCGYYTGIDRQHQGFSNYTLTTSDFNSLWFDVYVDTYRNALTTETAAESEGLAGVTKGIAQVIQAQAIGMAASLYGDVPFREAGRIEVDNPGYEDQMGVYAGVQALLDEAIMNLQSGVDRPAGGADIYFDGDATKWIEVAYTLKARMYMHTREYAEAFNAAQQGISSLANAMYGPHGMGLEESNLTYQFFAVEVRGADVVTSDFMASLVQADTSLNPIPANYRGNAKTNEAARFNFYFVNNSLGVQPNTNEGGFAGQTSPSPMVTYEENLLILAEAGVRTQGFAQGLSRLNDFRAFMATGGYLSNADLAQVQYDPYVDADFNNGG